MECPWGPMLPGPLAHWPFCVSVAAKSLAESSASRHDPRSIAATRTAGGIDPPLSRTSHRQGQPHNAHVQPFLLSLSNSPSRIVPYPLSLSISSLCLFASTLFSFVHSFAVNCLFLAFPCHDELSTTIPDWTHLHETRTRRHA